jgi:hypothetical protein
MKFQLLAKTLCAVAGFSTVTAFRRNQPETIPFKYIVEFKGNPGMDVHYVIKELKEKEGIQFSVDNVYDVVMRGMSATVKDEVELKKLKDSTLVANVWPVVSNSLPCLLLTLNLLNCLSSRLFTHTILKNRLSSVVNTENEVIKQLTLSHSNV